MKSTGMNGVYGYEKRAGSFLQCVNSFCNFLKLKLEYFGFYCRPEAFLGFFGLRKAEGLSKAKKSQKGRRPTIKHKV